jgi:D-lyxose ketol-isomerase
MQVCPVHVHPEAREQGAALSAAAAVMSCFGSGHLECVAVLLRVQVCPVHFVLKHENKGFEGVHYQLLLQYLFGTACL